MITHFIADTHLGHHNIIAHAGRPFGNAEEMDAAILDRYRSAVKETDVVAWVGDVSFRDFWWTKNTLLNLPGHKILIRGNHDGSISNCLKLGFSAVVDFMFLYIAGHKVTVAHMPPSGTTADLRYPERRPMKPQAGEYVLHGHTHEKVQRIGRRIHVGVDASGFQPVPMEKVVALIEGKE